MSVSEEYREYIIECLERVIPVNWRKMFGGIGIYHDERAGMEPFRPYGKKSYSMSYYEVPADVLEDDSALVSWVNKAVAAARAGKNSTRQKKRRKI